MTLGKKALYPGSFDPVTYGHIDLIKRACKIFDQVVVGVAHNTQKKTLFSNIERLDMIKEVTAGIGNIEVVEFKGLVVDFARANGINVLVRGLRMISDFEYELQMALTNRRLDETLETVFLMPSEGYSFLSSTLIKEAASLGADMSSFVPASIDRRLKEKYKCE
ncbi:MAG: pantetheine-phosphate adenylyltransferase [Candidatus Omnitrophota bacterium]